MSDTTPRASDDEATPLADETARELSTGEQLVQPSPDPADQTDTAAVAPLPPDYRPVAASEHVAPEPAVPTASMAPASDAAPITPAEASAAAPLVDEPVDPTDPAQHPDAVVAAAAAADADSDRTAESAPEAVTARQPSSAEPTAATTVAPVAEPTVAEPTVAPAAEPTPAPYAGATYISAPTPPKKKSNRGLGILIAVLGVVLFAAANLAATLAILTARYGVSQAKTDLVSYLEGWEFWVPLAVFAAAFIALVAIVNRCRWWAYILGSIFVAGFVFAAYFGAALLTSRIWERTPAQARTFAGAYFETNIPYLWVAVAATFIALEVVIWLGGWIAFHGQHAKRRYVEAKAAYDAEYGADR